MHVPGQEAKLQTSPVEVFWGSLGSWVWGALGCVPQLHGLYSGPGSWPLSPQLVLHPSVLALQMETLTTAVGFVALVLKTNNGQKLSCIGT